ncbi:MAG: hypothetical protein DHS20C15_02160 [Planctomycetota bacterium]|nr:MAG: hypothetical protein DHS20C15_02160 [Planctomycetota bacterium]
MRSDSESQPEGPPRRGAAAVVLTVVITVVIWRALEVPGDAASALQRTDGLTALETLEPRATPRLSETQAFSSPAWPGAASRPSLSATYLRSVRGAVDEVFVLHRDAARVSWQSPDSGRRVDFEQHGLDPRRVLSQLSVRDEGVVLDLALGDAASDPSAASWADCSLGGFTVQELTALRPTEATREAFGVEFRELRAVGEHEALREVWWNAELEVALEWRRVDASGEVRQVLQDLQRPARAGELRDPVERHPEWRRLDFADWLDEVSEG